MGSGDFIDLGDDAESVLGSVLCEIKSQVEYQNVYDKPENKESDQNAADE